MVLFASPGNPSGYIWSESDIKKLLEIGRKYRLLILADEIYIDFIWSGKHHSLIKEALVDDNIVVLSGFSKNLAVAGWRAGYAIGTPHRIKTMIAQHDKFCPGGITIAQHAIGQGWQTHTKELRNFIISQRDTYETSRHDLATIFSALNMEPSFPNGAIYMLIKHNRADDIAAINEILEQGVATTPGRVFFGDKTKSDYIRIHFAVPAETVSEVRRRLN